MRKITRRQFIKGAAIAGGAMMLPIKHIGRGTAYAFAQSDNLVKWSQSIRGLGGASGIPVLSPIPDPYFPNTDFYEISIGKFQDTLYTPPAGDPPFGNTWLYGFFDSNAPVKRHLGGIILASRNKPVRIRFTNELTPFGTKNSGHIIPDDQTITGASQGGQRTTVHLHGGFVPWISDGGPFSWFDPNGGHGVSFKNGPGSVLDNILGQPMFPGQADYYYPNDQSARLVWYHDHAFGITRINAYAGIASAYLITDRGAGGSETLYGNLLALPESALVWQDKVFVSPTTPVSDPTWATIMPNEVQAPGSLWYPHIYERNRFGLRGNARGGNLIPPDPSVIPEMFGDTMLCNGTVYPVHEVPAGAVRFHVLNACNARFLNLNLFVKDNSPDGITLNAETLFPTNAPGPRILQIGTEGGFLPAPFLHPGNTPFNPFTFSGNLLLAPAERADVVIDFAGYANGTEIFAYSDAPAPFPEGDPRNDYFFGSANPTVTPAGRGPDTRQILKFRVNTSLPATAFVPPQTIPQDQAYLIDPSLQAAPLPPPVGVFVRDLTLNETFDVYGRLIQLLGTTTLVGPGMGYGRAYTDPATETPNKGITEVWRIFNQTGDTHPIHFHLVNVQILSRQPFKVTGGAFMLTGVARAPEPYEVGYKETVRMNPEECTTVIMRFDLPTPPFNVPVSPRTGGNEYVWHCHILEHEEHDMMRPLVVF